MSLSVFLLDDRGYVYSADDAKRLRVDHRISGSLLGDIQRSKGETTDEGCLPLVLSPEELFLCTKKGWITLKATERLSTGFPQGEEISLKEIAQTGRSTAVQLPSSRSAALMQQPWDFPRSFEERLRCAVFEDLHSKGFFLTTGIKFGGDWLAYPGDPFVYHAQFVVRVAKHSDALHPLFHISAAREAHAARKHLLIAMAQEGEKDFQIDYVTVAPYDGFGKTDRRKKS